MSVSMKKIYITLGVIVLILSGFFIVWLITQKFQTINTSTSDEKKEAITYSDHVFTFETATGEFNVQYNADTSWAKIKYNNNEYELPNVDVDFGVKYANENESIVFWERQQEAVLIIDGQVIFENARLIENENSAITLTGFSLEETKWEWKETQYDNGEIVKSNTPESFILYFMADGRFSSKTDCNNVMGSFMIDGDSLSFGQMASTKMACLDEQVQEEIYTAMLIDAKTIKINDSQDLLEIGIEGSAKGTMIFTRFIELAQE